MVMQAIVCSGGSSKKTKVTHISKIRKCGYSIQKAWTWVRSLARHAVPLVKSPSVFTFGKHLSLFLFLAKVIYLLNFFSQVEYLTTSSCGKVAFA